MKDKFTPDERQFAWYIRNCLNSAVFSQIKSILFLEFRLFDSEYSQEMRDLTHPTADGKITETKILAMSLPEQISHFQRILDAVADPTPVDLNSDRTVAFATDEFELEPIASEILLFCLRCNRNSLLDNLADRLMIQLRGVSRALAAMLGVDHNALCEQLLPSKSLIQKGILTYHECDTGRSMVSPDGGALHLSPRLEKAMHQAYRCKQDWISAIIGTPVTTTLSMADFAHLDKERDMAVGLLRRAAGGRVERLNLLLHGPVGTGKTECCKVLAQEAGCTLWSVGEEDEEGGEPTRNERLASLRLSQHLLRNRPNALILLDEAEDVLMRPDPSGDRRRLESKLFVNRILEDNAVPILWTCNGTGNIPQSVLRRMTLAIQLRTPNREVRQRIWRRVLDQEALSLDAKAVGELSMRYAAPPAVAASAARAASLLGGGQAEIETAMSGVLRLLGIDRSPARPDGGSFEPSLTNCETDLDDLAQRLARPGAPRSWSLCLSGPPGTGKSQFARYLADRLGMEARHRRASDLLSPYIGETEQQIAAAFRDAARDGVMLIIDEAESLLHSRATAVRSWEVTQVNEMLTWMEEHPLPFICTTNLMDRLDAAALRRFTFKLRFDTLTPDQARQAFIYFFGMAAPCEVPDGLAPGDFATVRRKRQALGTADGRLLADWLAEEIAAKGRVGRMVGFRSGAPAGSA